MTEKYENNETFQKIKDLIKKEEEKALNIFDQEDFAFQVTQKVIFSGHGHVTAASRYSGGIFYVGSFFPGKRCPGARRFLFGSIYIQVPSAPGGCYCGDEDPSFPIGVEN
jgi:hypothetical protein